MLSSSSGMLKGGTSGGTPPEPPLIDFGGDDNKSVPPWPDHAAELDQHLDPFSWTTDELYISATPKDPFGFEGLLFSASSLDAPLDQLLPAAANLNNTGSGNASQASCRSNQSQAHAGGMDLLTGMSGEVCQPAPVAADPFAASSEMADFWTGSSFLDSFSGGLSKEFTAGVSTPGHFDDTSFLFNDYSILQPETSPVAAAEQPLPVFEDFSFVDALSEDLQPLTESPTSEATGSAVNWALDTQNDSHEKEGSGRESSIIVSVPSSATSIISTQQVIAKTVVRERNSFGYELNKEFEQLKISTEGQKAEVSADFAPEFDLFESEPTWSAKSTDVPTVTGPPNKPPPGLRPPSDSRSSSWASSSNDIKLGRQNHEFLASGGGKGVYRSPSREFVHAGHPVALELRPRPLKEMNQSIKTLLCTDTSVWAAFDFGLKVWDIETASGSCSAGTDNLLGDEDAAPYTVLAVNSGATLCLAMDTANQIIWSGHRDGKVRAWSLRVHAGDLRERDPIVPDLVWDAHQAPVTAITITSYGEMWTGSESGLLKAWPCEVTSRALQSAAEGDHAAAASLAGLAVPLRGPVNGNNPSQTEIRFLVAEQSAGRVWSAGIHFITLWDARTREMIKIFGASIHSQPNLANQEFSQGIEVSSEERVLRKEKGLGWLQRSRNAFIGAADAVRRAADRTGQALEEAKRLETVAVSGDGTVWGGLGNGQIVQWDGEGTRLQEVMVTTVAVKCLLAVGNRLWVGFANGRVEVLASRSGRSLGSWVAQNTPLAQMARGGNYVFTLSADGGIRGWHVASLSPLDSLVQSELSKRADSFTQQRHLRIFAGTWNVSQERASLESLRVWLAEPAAEASLLCVGLQEMEMGAGALGLAAVKETVGVGLLDKGSANCQWWLDCIGSAISEGKEFERLASRQLAGLLIGVWVRRKIRPFVGDVDAAAVACGFGRTFGNKGAVGVKLSAFRRTICLVNSHFAAHMEKVASRNADFEYVYNQMAFGLRLSTVANAAAGVSTAMQSMLRGAPRKNSANADFHESLVEGEMPLFMEQDATAEASMPELSETDILVWFGDFNYRIDTSYDQAIEWIAEKCYDKLLSKDQLRNEMASGRTFPGMREGGIEFPPTYKFDRGSQEYDTSEKRRVPAYCDRVVFRDSFDGSDCAQSSRLMRPAKVTVARYDACMEVSDSDHKPVRCLLDVDLAVIDEAARRREYGDIMQNDQRVLDFMERCNFIPQIRVNRNKVVLEGNVISTVRVTNDSERSWTTFSVRCEGMHTDMECPCDGHGELESIRSPSFLRGGYGFPQWLQVRPAAGVIGPNASITITLQYTELSLRSDVSLEPSDWQPRWWSETPKDACLELALIMTSSPMTTVKHQLCVRRAPGRPSQLQVGHLLYPSS